MQIGGVEEPYWQKQTISGEQLSHFLFRSCTWSSNLLPFVTCHPVRVFACHQPLHMQKPHVYSTSKTWSLGLSQNTMALPVQVRTPVKVSGFSVFVFLHWHQTPETPRIHAWSLIFFNAPSLQHTAARRKEYGSALRGQCKAGYLCLDSLLKGKIRIILLQHFPWIP